MTCFRRTNVRVLPISVLVVVIIAIIPGLAAAQNFPDHIDLPPGFRPEGIAVGRGSTFFVGSIPTGALVKGDLRTGEHGPLVPGDGESSIGLAVDEYDRVFVAGGGTGRARVIDGSTGDVLATYQLTTDETFINDVVVTGSGAVFTDSVNQVLYRVPADLGPHSVIHIKGDLQYTEGFNANGIDATPNGKVLFVVQSNAGRVYRVDPATGVSTEVDLGGETVVNGDGILLEGLTLYVVQNRLNKVAVIELSEDLDSGEVVRHIENEDFDVPTTIDRFGSSLYAVNARFTTPPTNSTEYWITRFAG